jgi:hypothetical protein
VKSNLPACLSRIVRLSRLPAAAGGLLLAFLIATSAFAAEEQPPISVSGRYPHLAMFNHQGECGTGAVVPWAGRLWVITYGPHLPNGSDDKLYEIDPTLHEIARPESVGGTPADRMIHAESQQLIIGPYLIDTHRAVRVITPKQMPGRLTAAARDLTDPANRIYVLDMEGALYEVDVHTLAVNKLFARVAPGAHAKGAYTAQGRLVIANNGNDVVNKAKPAFNDPGYSADPEASGILAQWDGRQWTTIERREFTDVTGPGGIEGSPGDRSPLWAIGWDKRSVILKLLDAGKWTSYRLPIADYSYVARHGWYTEWPRIRDVGNGKLLMNMHGGWFDFPKTFSAANTSGVRPIGNYLKITGDFAPWNGRIVFGCDDASKMQNPLLGQSQSNLWFTTWDELGHCGQPSGNGGTWVDDAVKAGEFSVPYLLAGYASRTLHLSHASAVPVTFSMEIDADGTGNWKPWQSVTIAGHGYGWLPISPEVNGEWIRIKTDRDSIGTTAYFTYGSGGGAVENKALFAALTNVGDKQPASTGDLRPVGDDRGTLLFDSRAGAPADSASHQMFEVTSDLIFHRYSGAPAQATREVPADKGYAVSVDDASAIISDGKGTYRLPIGVAGSPGIDRANRQLREVVTERFLLNVGGSFFMVPRPTAGGALRMKPVCTHGKQIGDFCSWRGMLVMSGCNIAAKTDGHYFASATGPGLWFGDIDDLWKMGKPRGRGGPWHNTAVKAGQASDPFLMMGYDHKTVEISDDASATAHIALEVDVAADGRWETFRTIDVAPGATVTYEFPAAYCAHWIRARTDTACHATVMFTYD